MFSYFVPDIQELLHDRGITENPGQEKYLPMILEGRDCLIVSPTGSGKTFATMIAIMSLLLEQRENSSASHLVGIRALLVSPLKSLNRDVYVRIVEIGQQLGIKIALRTGDTSASERRRQTLHPPEILITTPETLQAILPAKILGKKYLKTVQTVIIDEIHSLIDNKRGIQLSLALERLVVRTLEPFQRIGLSATISDPPKVAKYLAPASTSMQVFNVELDKKISIQAEYPLPKPEDESLAVNLFTTSDAVARIRRISELIQEKTTSLIFTNTRQFAELIGWRLKRMQELTRSENLQSEVHHSSLSRELRLTTEDNFRAGGLDAIVATSSLELGIDIGSVDRVIQVMSPRQTTTFVQRIGRSGHRLDQISEGIVILSNPRDVLEGIVIGKQALENRLEPPRVYMLAFDVLIHQIVGILLEKGETPIDDILRLCRRAFPYKDLTLQQLEEIVDFGYSDLHLWWKNDTPDGSPTLKAKRKAFEYYFSNLSTIPDVRRFQVIQVGSKLKVGVLDEGFVLVKAKKGVKFILKGLPWQILEINEDKQEITVQPLSGIDSQTIPSWEGELIPVEITVTREALALLNQQNIDDYPGDPITKGIILDLIKNQGEKIMPNANRIIIETFGSIIVCHTFLGSRANEALGVLLSGLLSLRFKAQSIGYTADPFAIVLKLPKPAPSLVLETLTNLHPNYAQELLDRLTRSSDLFIWKLQQVAQRMGVLTKKTPQKDYFILRKILQRDYTATPAGDEAIREIFFQNYDLETVKQFLKDIQEEKIQIEIVIVKELSPLAKFAVERGMQIFRGQPTAMIQKIVEKRINETRIGLTCMNPRGCSFSRVYTVKNLPERVICRQCNSQFLAVSHPSNVGQPQKLLQKEIRGEELTPKEQKDLRQYKKSADLILSQGKVAAFTMAGHGVGPTTASRILRKFPTVAIAQEELVKFIIEAESEFARTREYW